MKKHMIVIQLLMLISNNIFSQIEVNPIVKVDSQQFNFQKHNEVFSEMDENLISTGFLSDKSFQLISFSDYNGSDSAKTITLYKWRQLYAQVEASQVGRKYRYPKLDSIYYEYSKKSNATKQLDNESNLKKIKKDVDDEKFIPISVIDINYNTIKRDAFDKNLLTVSNQKIKEMPNIRESPYTIENLFVASVLKNEIYQGNNVNFLFDEDFYFTNKDESHVLYRIDFDDGLGLRDVSFGQTLNVNYTSIGKKTLRLIKIHNKQKSTIATEQLISSFSLTVNAQSTPSATFTIPLNVSIPSNYPHGGVNVQGTGYVYTSDGSTNIRNPIIICEGFDPENDRGWNELYDMLNRQNFIECLKSNGYDFIVLDFEDGGTYIERNAYLLKGLIENINTIKVTQNKLVIIGASMGGLVSRYALAYMEKNGFSHNTRLFVSFDSPQNGANIPLGVQYWFQFFSPMSSDIQNKYNNSLCSVAARQMLVYHSEYSPDPANNPYRVAFLQNLNTVGYPAKLRKIAIANGAGNAYSQRKNDDSVFNPTDQIINWHYSNFWTVKIDGNAWAVPDITPQTTIFYGDVQKTWLAHLFTWDFYDKTSTVTMEGSRPYDNAPGGTANTMEKLADSDTKGYGTIKSDIYKHCFIPTVSSLAINTSNLFYDISADPNILSKTPFDAIYYPVNTNEEHVYISDACVAWIMNELVPQNVVLDGSEGWNNGEVRAGNSITLKPGFSTASGATFRAGISPLQVCSNPLLQAKSISDDNYSISNQANLKIEKNNEVSIFTFPNPNNGLFCIQVKNSENIDYVEVVNTQGITIYKEKNTAFNELFIDITNQPSGIYFVNISLNGKTKTSKIIKN